MQAVHCYAAECTILMLSLFKLILFHNMIYCSSKEPTEGEKMGGGREKTVGMETLMSPALWANFIATDNVIFGFD